ncbi:TPA: hypothetical protein BOS_12466 [Bos taurus]|nr:TPA: hypothetical protein BOS_12466 [Bos taurus]
MAKLAPNKEEPSTFTWAVDNFEEKCPPKGKTGNVPPGAEAPHNPRLCLPTAPWTDLTPAPPPGFLHPAEAAGRAARGPPPTARLEPLRTPAAAAKKCGRRRRERAARPLPRAGSATVGCGRRLRCVRGCASRSVQPRSDPEPARPARPPPPPRRRPAGSSSPRRDARSSLLPRFTDSRGRRILPRSLRASLGLFPHRLPVGARAHTHTHTHTRRRACARPRARSRGISGAATHTGFQPPLGVLCLQQRRPRRRRGRRLQPGPVSELGAQDRVRGEAEKEGAEARRSRAAPAPGAAAPEFRKRLKSNWLPKDLSSCYL